MPFTELWLSKVSRYSPDSPNGYAFGDEFQRFRRVGCEYDDELIRVGVEELENREPGLLREGRRQCRGGVRRVRVPEQVIAQHLHVALEQPKRNEAAGGIVQIHLTESVQQRVFARTQSVERARRCVRRVSMREPRLHGSLPCADQDRHDRAGCEGGCRDDGAKGKHLESGPPPTRIADH